MNPLKKPNSFEEKLKKQLDGSEWKPSDALWDRIEQNMPANSFEPLLQEKLENFMVHPSEEVWGKVEAQLPSARKKRGLLWFGSLALLAILSFGSGYLLHQPSLIIKEEKVLASHSEGANQRLPKMGKQGIKFKRSEPKRETHLPAAKGLQPKNSLRSEIATVKVGWSKPAMRRASGNGLKQSTHVATPDTAASEVGRFAAGAVISNQVTEILGKTEIAQAIPTGSGQEIKAAMPEPKEIMASKNMVSSQTDSFAGEQIFRGNTYMEPEETFTQFSITAMGGMHQSYMHLSKPTASSYDLDKSYALRKETDKAAFDFSGAFLVNFHAGRSWLISAGIGITSFSQRVNFNVATAMQTNPTRVQPVNQYLHASDSIMAGKGNTLESKYSFTEIPIQLSYLFKTDGDFQFGLTGGFSYGRLNLVNAYLTDPSCVGLLLADGKDAFPKFKDVFFASFSPNVSMRLNSSASIGLMPQFKIGLHSMVDNQNWIQQRPALIGLNVFLRKRF